MKSYKELKEIFNNCVKIKDDKIIVVKQYHDIDFGPEEKIDNYSLKDSGISADSLDMIRKHEKIKDIELDEETMFYIINDITVDDITLYIVEFVRNYSKNLKSRVFDPQQYGFVDPKYNKQIESGRMLAGFEDLKDAKAFLDICNKTLANSMFESKQMKKKKLKKEDLTSLPPIPQKDQEEMNLLVNPLYFDDLEQDDGLTKKIQIGIFKMKESKKIVNKIVDKEIRRLLEDEEFRKKLITKIKKNKFCKKCLLPKNSCSCLAMKRFGTTSGAPSLLDKEEIENYNLYEVAVVKESNKKHTIMKDTLGHLSCDCSYYLNENNKGYCKHINKYLYHGTKTTK